MNNLEIAQSTPMRPIGDVAAEAGLAHSDYEPLGHFKAKLTAKGIENLRSQTRGKLILVSAITPTPAGEGKTTTAIGLAQGLRKLGRRSVVAIREPSLGPVFGVKGGACGGGHSQIVPMEDINLFFTGDFPAIAAAHNLLSALLDAHIHNGNELGIDVRNPMWPRTVDMNDRALRQVVVGLGASNGFPREAGFVITAASEVMATLCLSRSLGELKSKLGRIVVGQTTKKRPVTAQELGASGAMAALLRDAIRPNLVQTLEGGPALVHGGPFGNIAHGCSSVLSLDCALGMADYTVTEAGFASDLGAQKYFSILTPQLGKTPDAIVLVATLRALEHHGDGSLREGCANLLRHAKHLQQYGPPVVVAINCFASDPESGLRELEEICAANGLTTARSEGATRGGEGCVALAEAVEVATSLTRPFSPVVPESLPILAQLEAIVQKVYGGDGVVLSDEASRQLRWIEKQGFGELPVCIAKTQSSLSDDPKLKNAPVGFQIKVREFRVSAGAGFVVAVAGDIMLMPGLGKEPAALEIDVTDEGKITGLF
ncbi:MAG: formate--tetrahydrofolate ligase [Fimbriimonas sp.]